MKTKYIYYLLTLALLCVMNSCNNDEDDWDDISYELCSYEWYDTYVNSSGVKCEQTLRFYDDGTGTDYTTFYYDDGASENYTTDFYWQLSSSNYNYSDQLTLLLSYPNGTDSYENVQIGNGYIRCWLNGEEVLFQAI